MLAMMDHPNIISYYDSFEEDGTVVIEMEYADGGYVTLYFFCSYRPVQMRDTVHPKLEAPSTSSHTVTSFRNLVNFFVILDF